MGVSGFAPAKVNLYLHVGPPRADGFHPLDSLIAFADVGDRVVATPADGLDLVVEGPFAGSLATEPDNLVLRAARLLAAHAGVRPHAALRLEKHLPVASGIGGGSSDAAAALRVLDRLWHCRASRTDLEALAARLGADVPCCVAALPARMRGIGEDLAVAHVAPLRAVLANPLMPAPTAAVYRAFDALGGGSLRDPGPAPRDCLQDWLASQTNDLEAPAIAVAPVIADVLAALREAAPDALVRMSGSGATCFALTDDADAVAATLRARRPGWWVAAVTLGAVDVSVRDD
jgi:4-diphosphocytidyl-2-C-methyl-D-erythritol kinase